MQSAFIKSSLLDNAVFSISKATNADGSVEYTGRISSEKYLFKLININGQVVATGNGMQGNNTINANAKGMYILQLFASDKNYSKKIIKN